MMRGEEDALSAEMGKMLGDVTKISYRKSSTTTERVTVTKDAAALGATFKYGKQRIPHNAGGIATLGSDNKRTTLDNNSTGYFLTSDLPDTFTVNLGADYEIYIWQVNSLAQVSAADELGIGWEADGLVVTLDKTNYAYVVFNFRLASGSSMSATDVANLTNNFSIVYETEEVITDGTEAIAFVGANGSTVKALYNSNDTDKISVYTKEAVDAMLGNASRPIRVLQYNLGHFSCGTQETSNITSANYAEKLAHWKAKIRNIDADIIGMPEYAAYFGNNGSGSVATPNCGIFDGYNLSVGNSAASGWWINALASRFQMADAGDYDLGSTGSGVSAAYARYATIEIGGKSVKIVATHLNWAKTAAHIASRAIEIKNLIKWLQNDDYVILCGDFNTDGSVVQSASKTEADFMAGANEFDPFLYGFTEDGVTYEGGFTLANHGLWGDLKTCDATGSRPDHLTDASYGNNNPDTFYNRPFSCLDNIIVKGFRMSNVMVIDDGYLSDHCGVVCDLVLI